MRRERDLFVNDCAKAFEAISKDAYIRDRIIEYVNNCFCFNMDELICLMDELDYAFYFEVSNVVNEVKQNKDYYCDIYWVIHNDIMHYIESVARIECDIDM